MGCEVLEVSPMSGPGGRSEVLAGSGPWAASHSHSFGVQHLVTPFANCQLASTGTEIIEMTLCIFVRYAYLFMQLLFSGLLM